ncbi:MAG: hypothetical protein Q9183_005002 [Haloplaca sp. 2 TL-2023]
MVGIGHISNHDSKPSRRSTTSTVFVPEPSPVLSSTDPTPAEMHQRTPIGPKGYVPLSRPPTVHPPLYNPEATYSNSQTWVSPLTNAKDEWKRISHGLHALNLNHPDHSPFVPKEFPDYIKHKAEHLNDRKKEILRRFQQRQFASADQENIAPAFNGIEFNDNRSAVLGLESMWCPWYSPTKQHPEAPWPNKEEMREEGDERHTSQFGRFMALPRNPGNETVTYKQRSPVKQYFVDRVWEVPDPEDVGEEFEEEVMEELLGGKLMGELSR